MSNLETTVQEVFQLISYLKSSLNYTEELIGVSTTFFVDDKNVEKPVSTLNVDALKDLEFLTRKISSKADVLQNKLAELSSFIKK